MHDHGIAVPALPPNIARIVRIGVPVALIAAEALSFQSLYSLGRLVGWPLALAWLLPVALDVYAGVSTAVWRTVPDGHQAAESAARNARVAIFLTEGGNILNHVATVHGNTAHLALVLAVSALPPLVAERLLRLAAFIPKPTLEPAQDAAVAPDVPTEPVQHAGTPRKTARNRVAAVAIRPTAAQATIAEWWNADNARGFRTSSDKVAAETGVTPSYVRRIYRQLDALSGVPA